MKENFNVVPGPAGLLPPESPTKEVIAALRIVARRTIAALQGRFVKRGYFWGPEDHLAVILYAWLRGYSVHAAAEDLNNGGKEQFADGRRRRRVPHQTSVNEWLAKIPLKKAKQVARVLLGEFLKWAREEKLVPKRVVVSFDLTYRGYWGSRRDPLIKGSLSVPGTRRIRHYHGAVVHAGANTFFIAADHIARKESKIPFVVQSIKWLKSLGFGIKRVLCDREYYQTGLLASLRAEGVPVIIPVKNYTKAKESKKKYLKGGAGRIQRFTVQSGRYTRGKGFSTAPCWLVVCAKRGHQLGDVRRAFRNGKITIDEGIKRLHCYVTTINPQGHGHSFPNRVEGWYRSRWRIETAYRDYLRHCGILRSDLDGPRLLGEVGRMLVYNTWQAFRHARQPLRPESNVSFRVRLGRWYRACYLQSGGVLM